MSIWKRKKKKLEKTQKPEKEESVIEDFVDTLTYDKTEEEKKKTLTQMDSDDKIVAVPTVSVNGQPAQASAQSAPQQIVININIPSPLNKSEMHADNKADMPKAPPLPKVPTISAKTPAAPRVPTFHTTVIRKSDEKSSLNKNMQQGYAGQPPSNLMQMSQEPLKKDVVDLKTRKKIGETGQDLGELKSTTEKIKNALEKQKIKNSPNTNTKHSKEESHRHFSDRQVEDLNRLKSSKQRIDKLMTEINSEPLKKDVVDMSKWKRRKQKEELDNLPTEQEMKDALFNPKPPVDTRSRDQKIKDALKAQAKQGSPYSDLRSTGGGSNSSKAGSKNIKAADKDTEQTARLKSTLGRLNELKSNQSPTAKKARQNPKDKKYRKLLDQRDSGDASLKGKSDMEIAQMAGIKMMEPSKPKQRPEPHQDVKGYYQARFSDNPEAMNRIEELWSKDHDEPYSDGVLGQTNWRKGKDVEVEKGWKEMPIASKATPQSIGGILGKKVISGEGPDPFHWVDAKYQHTKKLLEQHKDLPLKIHTRSDLIANDDYMAHLNPKKHEVNIHVAFPENKWDMSSDENVMEPGQPSTKRRLTAYKKLKDAGIPVKIIVDRLKTDHEHPLLTNNKAAASQLRDMGIPKEDINFNEIQLDKHGLGRIAEKTGMPPHNPNRKKKHLSPEKKADNLSMIKEALSRRNQ